MLINQTVARRLLVIASVAGLAGGCSVPLEPTDEEVSVLSSTAPGSANSGSPPYGSLAATSNAGFHSPLPSVPTYNCKFASAGGVTYTTLWGDNEDGGAKAKATAGYAGSLCDSYDDISGKTHEGQFCGSHPGVDLAVASGTPVYAINQGTVFAADPVGSGGWGKYIVLAMTVYEKGSPVTIYVTYAHLSSVTVAKGASVTGGQQLGLTGNTGNSTGAHLHFQIDKATQSVHPYWPSGAPNTPDYAGNLRDYTYNPLTAIGFGTCY